MARNQRKYTKLQPLLYQFNVLENFPSFIRNDKVNWDTARVVLEYRGDRFFIKSIAGVSGDWQNEKGTAKGASLKVQWNFSHKPLETKTAIKVKVSVEVLL